MKGKKQRIEYIDAMRGFTMVLVVLSHVLMYTFSSTPTFSFNDVFLTFRMPLFFFLSGFLMYRNGRFDKIVDTGGFMKQKFIVQLIPTFIFSFLYALIAHLSYKGLWLDKAKGGYWFTYTLFFFFLIYSVGDYLLGKVFHGKLKLLIGSGIAILIYFFSKYSLTPGCPWSQSWINGFLGLANFQYFLFFFFGALVKSHLNRFFEIIDNPIGMMGILVSFIALLLVLLVPSISEPLTRFSIAAYSVLKTITGFFGITIVFAFFRKYQDSFKKDKVLGRGLQYIGERTLDIYLLQVFFVYANLQGVGAFFTAHCNPILELFAGLLVSLAIIIVCLVLSNMIRCSNTLAKLLFGKVIE